MKTREDISTEVHYPECNLKANGEPNVNKSAFVNKL